MKKKPASILNRVQRGLAGYISYLAACDANTAFSEYTLYEPILRLLLTQGYSVKCEFPLPGMRKHRTRGDHKKIDFRAYKDSEEFAIEVKWIQETKISLKAEIDKFDFYLSEAPGREAFLCIFGRQSHVNQFEIDHTHFIQRETPLIADFSYTRYVCAIYQKKTEQGAAANP